MFRYHFVDTVAPHPPPNIECTCPLQVYTASVTMIDNNDDDWDMIAPGSLC